MDSTQKFFEDNILLQLDIEVESLLTRRYGDLKWDIIEVLNWLEYKGDEYMVDTYAFVVKLGLDAYFFVADILFETPKSVFVLDIREIDSDTLLDFINENKYIRHGV